MDGAYKALDKLRSEGLVKSIGVGCNERQVCDQALRERDFDCFLLAGRYTLLEQDALDSFLPLCEARNVAIALGGGYNSGILATGAVDGAHYNYSLAPEPVLGASAPSKGSAGISALPCDPQPSSSCLRTRACLRSSGHAQSRASRRQSEADLRPDPRRFSGPR